MSAANTVVGVEGTIGGDVTAWYSGYNANMVTSVAVWDEAAHGRGTAQKSLGGLGGVAANDSAQWPADVWSTYTTAVTSGTSPILQPSAGRTFAALPSPDAGVYLGPPATPSPEVITGK